MCLKEGEKKPQAEVEDSGGGREENGDSTNNSDTPLQNTPVKIVTGGTATTNTTTTTKTTTKMAEGRYSPTLPSLESTNAEEPAKVPCKKDYAIDMVENISLHVIIRDMTSAVQSCSKASFVTPANSSVGELLAETGRRFKYEPDSFTLVLQLNGGKQTEMLEKCRPDCLLSDAGFNVELGARNSLIMFDLDGVAPRRTDVEDELILGASASPTTTSKWVPELNQQEKSYDSTPEYSYAPVIKQLGYVGLVNQAATCYLNSLLQTLYMTPEFRNALYKWEFTGNEDEACKNIPCQLQRLFLQLQTANKNAVETTSLTRSFGWDSSEAWQQHDIQELCRVMFDALEQCFKHTDQADFINMLYEGKMKDYVKCLECGTESAREDTFLDIPLPIRPFGSTTAFKSVEEALKAFVEPELLTGNNKYKCSKCDNLTDAHKGLKFTRFPYVLTIHLKRFDFDYQTLHRIKLNDKVTFPTTLDLNCFVNDSHKTNETTIANKDDSGASAGVGVNTPDKLDDASTSDSGSGSALDAEETSSVEFGTSSSHNDNHVLSQEEDEGIDVSSVYNEKNKSVVSTGPFVYELFSIMIHSGSASGGHYYAYIKDFKTGEWFCFNDQNVTKITYDDIRKTYGGSGSRGYYSSWTSSSNAYMLMYRRHDKEQNVYAITKHNYPLHVKELVEKLANDEVAEREAREVERLMCRIKLFCQHPKDNQMVEKKLKIHKDTTFKESTKIAYEELGLESYAKLEQCRLVKYEDFDDSIECSFENQDDEPISEVLGGVKSSYKFDLLMEIREPHKTFDVYKTGGSTIKVYIVNLKTEEVEGPHTVRASLGMTIEELKQLLGRTLDLKAEHMRIILEKFYNDIRPLFTDDKTLKAEGFYRSNKIYIEASGEEPNDFFKGSCMGDVLKRYENTITLYCTLPDTSPEALKELQIPPYNEQEEKTTPTETKPMTKSAARRKERHETKLKDESNVNKSQSSKASMNGTLNDAVDKSEKSDLLPPPPPPPPSGTPTDKTSSSGSPTKEKAVKSTKPKVKATVKEKLDPTVKEKIDATAKEKVDVTAKEKVDGTAKEKVDVTVKEKVDVTVKEKVDATVKEKVDATVKEKVDATVKEKVDATVKEKVDATVKELVDATVKEKVDATAKEKVDSTAKEKIDSTVKEKNDATAEEKVDKTVEEKETETTDVSIKHKSSCKVEFTLVISNDKESESKLEEEKSPKKLVQVSKSNKIVNTSNQVSSTLTTTTSIVPISSSENATSSTVQKPPAGELASLPKEPSSNKPEESPSKPSTKEAATTTTTEKIPFKPSALNSFGASVKFSSPRKTGPPPNFSPVKPGLGVTRVKLPKKVTKPATSTNSTVTSEAVVTSSSVAEVTSCKSQTCTASITTVTSCIDRFSAVNYQILCPTDISYFKMPTSVQTTPVISKINPTTMPDTCAVDSSSSSKSSSSTATTCPVVPSVPSPSSSSSAGITTTAVIGSGTSTSVALTTATTATASLGVGPILSTTAVTTSASSGSLGGCSALSGVAGASSTGNLSDVAGASSTGNLSDGEDETIDSVAGSSTVNSDQSASEDSSLTSDSDRTLVGDPPEDKSESSESADGYVYYENYDEYHNVSSSEGSNKETNVTDAVWDDPEAKQQELKRYFRASYTEDAETKQKLLKMSVDKRITIGQLKIEMQKWIGVSEEHFKLFKIFSNSQEFECTRMTENLISYGDNARLMVKLGRALLPGEHRGKIFLLQPHNSDDPAKYLIDWVICSLDKVENVKAAIVKEINLRCKMELDVEKVRLRKKSWKNPQTIHLNHHLFEKDIPIYSNWELFLQELDGPEPKSNDGEELSIFVKHWKPSSYTTEPLKEIIIKEQTSQALKQKLGETSGIPVENVEFCKGKSSFPCDMSVLDINSELDWSAHNGPLDQRPLYILDDGNVVYYRDKEEALKELSDSENKEISASENRRLNRDQYPFFSSASTTTPSQRYKEKGLRIYLNNTEE